MARPTNQGFDHMTVVVEDLEAAKRFFGLLGFVERVAVVAAGPRMAHYMGIPDWESDHVTLVLESAPVHQEIQLLHFHHPAVTVDTGAGTLTRTGFNHVCFRVDDLDAMLEHLASSGVTPRNEVLDYHQRKLVFLDGPGVVVELAEWVAEPTEHAPGGPSEAGDPR
jgi:catechol 2,3-dioxygenase-like lactoylglutathione lyase family enzyme